MPYIPLQLSKVLQPGSFTPSIGARTRYGIMSNPWDAKNFYCFMRISGVTAGYDWATGQRQFIAPTSFEKNGVRPGAIPDANTTVFPQA